MGLFDWIGETIGNACSALAEFFGDTLGAFFTGISNSFMEGAADMMDIKKEASSVYKYTYDEDGEKVRKFVDDGVLASFYKYRAQLMENFGEVDLSELNEAVQGLAKEGIEDIGVQTALHMIMTVGTAGQVNVLDEIWSANDIPHGMYNFCKTKKQLEQQIRFWIPYTRYLNRANPNTLPGPSDLVRMQLREVFHPDYRPELLEPPPSATFGTAMKEQGFSDYWSDSFWAAHWVLPSMGDLDEMLHRRIIEPRDWEIMVRRNDYLPAWIENRKKIIYSPYTRVDTRRMWDLRMLTPEELKSNYLDLGYDEEHAEKMTAWTMVYVAAGDIRARYSKGWITATEARTELLEAGMPEERVDVYLEKLVKETETERTSKERDLTKTDITRSVKKGLLTKDEGAERLTELGYSEDEAYFIIDITVSEGISSEIEADRDLSKADIIKGVADGVFTEAQGIEMLMKLGYDETDAKYILEIRVPPKKPEKMKPERDLTKAEIVKGVKKEIITWNQGAIMLVDMGYDSDEADYILAINVEALAGSPETWSAMQDIVNKGRRAMHRPVKEIPSGIRDIEEKLKEYTKERIEAVEAKKPRQEIINIDNKILPLKRQHRQLVEQYQKGR